MNSILQLFIRNGGFVTLVVLEVFCFYLIVEYNERQRSIFTHTSTVFNKTMAARRAYFGRYISAADSLQALNYEIFRLQTELDNAKTIRIPSRDTFFLINLDTVRGKIAIPQYRYIGAEVINNSIASASNWITLNRGKKHGLKPNMGVVSADGLVGITRYVSDDFTIVMSVLHRQTRVSATLKNQGYFGSLIWDGGDPDLMILTDIPKHVNIKSGDTVVTSGYSSMYPRGLMVGTIVKDSIPAGSNFYSLTVKLNNKIGKTNFVRVIENIYQHQLDSLMRIVQSNEQQ